MLSSAWVRLLVLSLQIEEPSLLVLLDLPEDTRFALTSVVPFTTTSLAPLQLPVGWSHRQIYSLHNTPLCT